MTVAEVIRTTSAAALEPGLFQVWIDLSGGAADADWWWNSEPKGFQSALAEAADCWANGWVAQVLPHGVNPRADGRWDNP